MPARTIFIPQKSPDDSECHLPEPYHSFCIQMKTNAGWSETCEKCWMHILACKMQIGNITFIVDPKIKTFDWNSLPIRRAPEKSPAGPEIFEW